MCAINYTSHLRTRIRSVLLLLRPHKIYIPMFPWLPESRKRGSRYFRRAGSSHFLFESKQNVISIASVTVVTVYSPFMTNNKHTHYPHSICTSIYLCQSVRSCHTFQRSHRTSRAHRNLYAKILFIFSHLFHKCKRSANFILSSRTNYMLVSLCHNDRSWDTSTQQPCDGTLYIFSNNSADFSCFCIYIYMYSANGCI